MKAGDETFLHTVFGVQNDCTVRLYFCRRNQNGDSMAQVHYIYDLDDTIVFGKHEGKTIQEILDCDAQYIY